MEQDSVPILRRRCICTIEVTAVLSHLSPLRLRLVPLDTPLDFLLPIRAKPDHSVFTESNDEESDDLPYTTHRQASHQRVEGEELAYPETLQS